MPLPSEHPILTSTQFLRRRSRAGNLLSKESVYRIQCGMVRETKRDPGCLANECNWAIPLISRAENLGQNKKTH